MLFTDGGLGADNPQVLCPGSGGTTHLTKSGGENPDPTTSCPSGYGANRSGLPIVAILPTPPASQTEAALTGPGGNLSVCVIDQNNFNHSDPVYGSTALQYFQSGLVLVIPKEPLVPGDYTVHLTPGDQASITWTFHSVPKAMPPSLSYAVLCSFTNPSYASGQAQIGITNPSTPRRRPPTRPPSTVSGRP
jgi:hypothetical protein